MNAAVTGATGFLGRALLPVLAPQFDQIRALVRRADDEPLIRKLGATPIHGDLIIPGGCDGLARVGDVLFHAAARVELLGTRSDFFATTVEGTRRLLDAALPLGLARFVYISSAAVYSLSHAGPAVRADRTPTRPAAYNYYGQAKLAAETLVRAECERAGCPWTILRLGFLYGPGNRGMVTHFLPMLDRKLVYVIGNGKNRIAALYVDDAARAVLLAGTHPSAAGRVYDVANDEHVTQREYMEASAAAFGRPPPARRIPRGVAFAAARFEELTARLRGRPPRHNRAMVSLMSADQVIDAGRIRDELGWRPRVAFREGMIKTRE